MASPDKQTFAATVISVLKGIVLKIKGNASIIGDNTGDQSDATLPFSDITTNNASILKHGFLSKLPNSNLVYLNGLGLWAVPSGTGVATITTNAPIINIGTATNPILAFQYKTQASIVAHAGGTQALATPLLAEFNSVDTVANALDSVLLLPATEGVRQYVYNNGTNNLNVYPQPGQNIKGKAANVALMLMPHNGTWFTCYVATPSEVGTFRLY
jgi:hypothetical protein